MVEIFELIMNYPLQFLAGLGVSSGTIYAGFKFIKGLISLITKKSAKAKELLKQDNIAQLVVTKLGGVDGFCNKVADIVIDRITTNSTIAKFKKLLEELANKDECPIEIKAYIETVLSQSGSEELHLLYEQTKSTLIAAAKQEVNNVIEEGTNIINEEQPKIEEPKIDKNNEQIETTTTLAQPKEEEVIVYA